jgi:hypothetical protein
MYGYRLPVSNRVENCGFRLIRDRLLKLPNTIETALC